MASKEPKRGDEDFEPTLYEAWQYLALHTKKVVNGNTDKDALDLAVRDAIDLGVPGDVVSALLSSASEHAGEHADKCRGCAREAAAKATVTLDNYTAHHAGKKPRK